MSFYILYKQGRRLTPRKQDVSKYLSPFMISSIQINKVHVVPVANLYILFHLFQPWW